MKIQSNWHKGGYQELVEQAAGELRRAHSAQSLPELKSAIDAFCLKIGAVTEFVFNKHIRGSHLWEAQNSLFDFQQWQKGKCHAIAQLHTANTMIKHPEIDLDRHDVQLDECSYSVVDSVSYGVPLRRGAAPAIYGMVQIGERPIDTDDGPAIATTYVAPNFWLGGEKKKLVEVAEHALQFWRAFDPALGPDQMPNKSTSA